MSSVTFQSPEIALIGSAPTAIETMATDIRLSRSIKLNAGPALSDALTFFIPVSIAVSIAISIPVSIAVLADE
jgi:hypothetical protein